jgi:phosphate:Na+ symporter
VINPFVYKKSEPLEEIRNRGTEVRFLHSHIYDYLVKIMRKDLDESQIEETFHMMYALDEYEQIGEIITGQLVEKGREWCMSGVEFSDSGKEELLDFHMKTLGILYQSYRIFSESDVRVARKSKQQYNYFRKQYFELEKQHYERLKLDIEESVESSRIHLDLIALLKDIGSHATNIARIVLRENRVSGGKSDRSTHNSNGNGHKSAN